MDHLTRNGEPKLLDECTLPLTGKNVVDRVITDLGVVDVTSNGFQLVELAPDVTLEEFAAATGVPLVDQMVVA